MKRLFQCICVAICAHVAYSQSQPIIVIDNIAMAHEERGWRVIDASTVPIHFNLTRGDLIVRIDGKNASETGPMMMASLFNQGNRNDSSLFIERGDLRMETRVREMSADDIDSVGANPFKHVARGFSAPDAEFKSIDGQIMTLDRFRGKWLLIDFMATWCPPCMEKLPRVLSIAEHNQLSLLTIAIHDRPGAVQRMRQAYKINSPIAIVQNMSELPIDFGITTNLFSGEIPALVLIRPDGDVALIEIGCFDPSRLEKAIAGLMSADTDEVVKEFKCSCEP